MWPQAISSHMVGSPSTTIPRSYQPDPERVPGTIIHLLLIGGSIMRILRNFFVAAIAIVALFSANNAFAQCPDLPAIGTFVTCSFVNGVKVLTPVGQPSETTPSSGSATFEVTGHILSPACEAILTPREFFSQGQSPRLGQTTSTLGQNPPRSSIKGSSTLLFPSSGAQLTINLSLNVNNSTLGQLQTDPNTPLVLTGKISNLHPTNVKVAQSSSATVRLVTPSGAVRATLSGTSVTLNGQGN